MDRFGHEKVPLIDFAPKKNMDGSATSCVTDPQVKSVTMKKRHIQHIFDVTENHMTSNNKIYESTVNGSFRIRKHYNITSL